MTPALIQRIAAEHAAALASPSPTPNAERRRAALKVVTAEGLPTSRDENWKYANLRSLERTRFAPRGDAASPPAENQLPPRVPNYARYTFVDGVLATTLSDSSPRSIVSVSASSTPPSLLPDLRFALLNEAFARDSVEVRATADAGGPHCIELVMVATQGADVAASYPRIELKVDAGAQLSLIERHISVGSDANFINTAVHVEIGAGARVDHYRLQHAGARATFLDTLIARVAEHAAYRLYAMGLGAQSARSTLDVELSGREGQFELHAVSVAGRQQVHDLYARIEHAAPQTRSRQTFRGIAAGRSRVACNSKVVVQAGAHGADAYQSLRGLLAGTEAEIDVRPQLEIHTDEVRCAHGATAGKLDDNMLFYLLSRGIEPDTAERLLKWAFLEDVVSKIGTVELRREIEQTLAGQMNVTDLPTVAS